MNEGRLLRALARGGVGAICAEGLSVYRSGDLRSRPVGCLSGPRFEELVAQGLLVREIFDDRDIWVWKRRARMPDDAKSATWSGQPPGPATALQRRGQAPGRFLDHLTNPDDPGGHRRAAAVARFEAEAEQAASGPSVTMNWRGLAEGRISGGPAPSARSVTGGRARRNLQALATVLGKADLRRAEGLVIREWSCAAFMRREGGLRREEAHAKARAVLDRLADAYDQCVPRL